MLRNVAEILTLSCQNMSVYHLPRGFLGKLGKKTFPIICWERKCCFLLLKVLYLIELLQFVVHHTSMLQTAANKCVVRAERGFKNCIVSSSFTHLSMCTLFFFFFEYIGCSSNVTFKICDQQRFYGVWLSFLPQPLSST